MNLIKLNNLISTGLILGLLLLIHQTLDAQEFETTYLKTSDGLPSPEVYKVFTSSKGNLWFLTDKGIAKYNGSSFNIFNTSNSSLTTDVMFSIVEDAMHNLWVSGLDGSISMYDSQNDSFILKAPSNEFRANLIFQFVIVEPRHLLFFPVKSDRCAPIKYDIATQKFSYVNHLKSWPTKLIDKDGTTTPFRRNKYQILGEYGRLGYGQQIFTCPNKKQYTFYNNTVYLSEDGSNFTELFSVKSKINYLKFIDSNIFIASYQGLYEFDTSLLELKSLSSDHDFSSVGKDYDGQLWASTLNNGVVKYQINNLTPLDLSKTVRNGNGSIIKISKFENNWIAASKSGEIIKISTDLGASLLYRSQKKQNIPSLGLNLYDSFLYIIDDYQSKKLNVYNNHSSTTRNKIRENIDTFLHTFHFSVHSFPYASDTILCPYPNAGGFLIYKYDSIKDIYEVFYRLNNANLKKISKIISYKNQLLIGTIDGLWTFNKHDFTIKKINISSNNRKATQITDITCNDSVIVVGTNGQGLYLARDLNRWEHKLDNQLVSNVQTGLSTIDNGTFWVSTNTGAHKVLIYSLNGDYELKIIYSLNIKNGLSSNYIYDLETIGDQTLFATDNGLEVFNSAQNKSTNRPPLLKLSASSETTVIKEGDLMIPQ